jgi:citrate lyase gamma subunit
MPYQLLTYSRTQDFKSCRRRHYWAYEVGIRPTLDAKALRMGTAYHAGLDVLKQGKMYDFAAEAVRAQYADVPTETVDRASAWDFECETVVALVSGYEWRWSEQKLKVIASERTFCLPLVNPETGASSRAWMLAGKIDGIVELEDGRLAVLEHKLQGDDIEPESEYWRRLQLDHQITLYVYAARQLGYDVATVLYDVARKPTIRTEQVPILDEQGLKIVLDASGKRVAKRKKPLKKCERCGGTGEMEPECDGTERPYPCGCTFDGWRQTGDMEKGYVLQSRPMTCEEWTGKLVEDIGQRPRFYYARQEIARLDQDIADFQVELWDIQKTLREAQLTNRWYRTVGRDTCPWCPYFGLCTSKFNPTTGLIPEGFQYVVDKHPELEGLANASNSPA